MEFELIKLCVVCGDRANGYNFSVITCESCKAFFRRNALRKKDFKCPFNSKCRIDTITRKFCQKCRLQKCFDTGMKKDLILTEEEKRLIKYKIAENKQKRIKLNENDSFADTTSSSANSQYFSQQINHNINHNNHNSNNEYILTNNCLHLISPNIEFNIHRKYENQFQSTIFDQRNSILAQQLTNCDKRVNTQSVIKFAPIEAKKSAMNSEELKFFDEYFVLNKLEELFRTESENESKDADMSLDIQLNKCRRNIIQYCCNKSNKLNDLEQRRVNELTHAFTELGAHSLASECAEPLDCMKMTDQAVRRVIQMTKQINGFRNLCQHDQMALMKAGCTELIILRSVKNYNFEREFWTLDVESRNATLVKMDVFKMSAVPSIYEAHKKFMLLLAQEWDADMDILNLLSTIILFDPNRHNIIHKNLIVFEQQTYKYLLQRYLEFKYTNISEAKLKFQRLMTTLDELHTLNEENVKWHLEVDPREIAPLLIEIFDLKR